MRLTKVSRTGHDRRSLAADDSNWRRPDVRRVGTLLGALIRRLPLARDRLQVG